MSIKAQLTITCWACGCGPWSLNEQGEAIAQEHALLTGHEDFAISDGGSMHLPAPPFHILCNCGFKTTDRMEWARHIQLVKYAHAFRRVMPTPRRSEKEVQHQP